MLVLAAKRREAEALAKAPGYMVHGTGDREWVPRSFHEEPGGLDWVDWPVWERDLKIRRRGAGRVSAPLLLGGGAVLLD
jgi:hypothetical protein